MISWTNVVCWHSKNISSNLLHEFVNQCAYKIHTKIQKIMFYLNFYGSLDDLLDFYCFYDWNYLFWDVRQVTDLDLKIGLWKKKTVSLKSFRTFILLVFPSISSVETLTVLFSKQSIQFLTINWVYIIMSRFHIHIHSFCQ